MAASATSLFPPLYLRPPHFSLLPPHPHPLYSLSSPLLKPLHPLSLLPTKHCSPLRASPSDQSDPDTDTDTKFVTDPNKSFDYDSKDDPPLPSPSREGMYNPPAFYDAPPESEEDIARAYEELYGPGYSGVSYFGHDVYAGEVTKEEAGWDDEDGDESEAKIEDGFEERVAQVRRVNKVVEGGKQIKYRVVVIVGDHQGHIGVGVGKGTEVVTAIKKSTINARRNVIKVPLTKYMTFPHRYLLLTVDTLNNFACGCGEYCYSQGVA